MDQVSNSGNGNRTFKEIVDEKLLPVIEEIFQGYDDSATCVAIFGSDPTNYFLAPTAYLYRSLYGEFDGEQSYGLNLISEGRELYFDIGNLDENYKIVLSISETNLSLLVLPVSFNDPDELPLASNIAISPDRPKKMYVYGVKANGPGPRMQGNQLNASAMDIFKAMHIPEVYINDGAGVACFWDNSIELQHFSILRVMVGKLPFYASLKGHYFDEVKAREEIAEIQAIVSEEEKAYINHYLERTPRQEGDNCERINAIIEKGMERPHQEILKYVATPYDIPGRAVGGYGKTRRRGRKARRTKYRKSINKSKHRKSKHRKTFTKMGKFMTRKR